MTHQYVVHLLGSHGSILWTGPIAARSLTEARGKAAHLYLAELGVTSMAARRAEPNGPAA